MTSIEKKLGVSPSLTIQKTTELFKTFASLIVIEKQGRFIALKSSEDDNKQVISVKDTN